MLGSINNVSCNSKKARCILLYLYEDDTTIGIISKYSLESKSPYMIGNIRPNLIMLVSKYFIQTLLYKI